MNQVHNLDKLEQLRKSDGTTNRITLRKRAKARFAQSHLIQHLINLESPLRDKYESTMYCSATLVQHGKEITARYCGHRWCRICNRIRTGKLINGYESEIKSMNDCQFVTLTIPNVPGEDLRTTIVQMTSTIRRIQDTHRKSNKRLIRCIRKIECTYNVDCNNYHPHLHFLVDGKESAQYLVDKWLSHYPEASIEAQDIREAESPLELFKYFTKLTSKSKSDRIVMQSGKVIKRDEYHYPEALDLIFQAIAGLRVIQPMGGIKIVSDEIDEVQSEVITDVESDTKVWIWHSFDWIDPHTGEMLTEYNPTIKEMNYSKRIRYLQT
jgi:hypothetical protein